MHRATRSSCCSTATSTGAPGRPGAPSFDAQVRAAGSILRAHATRGMRSVLVLGRAEAPVVRLASLDGDWPLALEALAAAEPDGRPLVERARRRARPCGACSGAHRRDL